MHLSTQIARLATTLALVAAIAAVTTPDARSGHQDLGARSASHPSERTDSTDALDRYLRNNAPSVLRPDDQPGAGEDASDALSRYLGNRRPDVAPDALDRYLRNNAPSVLRPDDQPGARGVGVLAGEDASDALSRYLTNNHPDVLAGDPANGTSFDWSDAGVGAGGILGILLLAGAAAFGVRERRGRLTTH